MKFQEWHVPGFTKNVRDSSLKYPMKKRWKMNQILKKILLKISKILRKRKGDS